MHKIKILFLSPGPTYNARSKMYKAKFLALSSFLQGYLLTSADSNEVFSIGNFEFRSCARKNKLNNFRFVVFCLCQAFRIKKAGGVDCIITYDPLKTGFVGVLLKKILHAKLVVEVNGVYTSPVVWQDGHDSFIKMVKQWFVPKLMSFVFRFSDGIKLQFSTQIMQFQNVITNKPIVTFSDWVPSSNFKNLGEKKEILLVGFPFRIKGVDILIMAFKQIASQFPDWNLKILGWYPDMSELSAAIGNHPKIHHHPPVSYPEMKQHIGECGIFVLPSRTDARPRVLIEAAAAGKARIGSNVDGIPTIINDGVDGFLIKSENVEDLAKKMAMLMKDDQLRHKIGKIAEKRAKSEFSEERYVENLMTFLNKVIPR